MRDRLFKPFQTNKRDGHGIGLALVKRFVDNFGGSVTRRYRAGPRDDVSAKLPIQGSEDARRRRWMMSYNPSESEVGLERKRQLASDPTERVTSIWRSLSTSETGESADRNPFTLPAYRERDAEPIVPRVLAQHDPASRIPP